MKELEYVNTLSIRFGPEIRGIPDLKPGDEVLQKTTWMSSRDNNIHKVLRITKTGKIRLEDGRLFSREGTRKEPGWGTFILFKRNNK